MRAADLATLKKGTWLFFRARKNEALGRGVVRWVGKTSAELRTDHGSFGVFRAYQMHRPTPELQQEWERQEEERLAQRARLDREHDAREAAADAARLQIVERAVVAAEGLALGDAEALLLAGSAGLTGPVREALAKRRG